MGNRVKGRVKKKSIKAALASNAGSKRKLSRMGKKQKKGHAGLEATFIGRSRCLKLLQLTIKDFRRLCILKGIYPREPVGRVPGKKKGQTYYHIKDIRAIAHEPILENFREFRAFMKKVRRSAGRNELDEAARKNALLPTYTLHHLVKERYPRFTDALSDLDDALSLTYLFASLPTGKSGIPVRVIQKAKSLAAAWGAYCATASVLTKGFVSVKGIYLEAVLYEHTTVRWVIPHAFTQFLPDDVDFRVMRTFQEFYETLLNFVLFKLFADMGIRYPLTTNPERVTRVHENLRTLRQAMEQQNKGGVVQSIVNQENTAISTSSDSKKANGHQMELVGTVSDVLRKVKDDIIDKDNGSDSDDEDDDEKSVDMAGPLHAALEQAADEEARQNMGGTTALSDNDERVQRRRLFQGLCFFFSREVPRGYLELVSLSFGAQVGWEGDEASPISMNDPSITHHIVDRPKLPTSYESSLPKSREYVQPQWILDCANFMLLLPIDRYKVGATLPPHLSPWVDDEEEGYKPAYAEEIERLKNGEAPQIDEDGADLESGAAGGQEGHKEEIDEIPSEEDGGNDDEEDEGKEEEEKDETIKKRPSKKRQKRKDEEDEAHILAKTMMSRKAAHLYGRMQHGIAKKQAAVDELHKRRAALDCAKGKDSSGRTVQKQKVDRLKKERKELEGTYGKPEGSMKRKKSRKK